LSLKEFNIDADKLLQNSQNNRAEKPDLTLETCVNLANSFVAKFSKKFKRMFWVQFCTSLPSKNKADSKPHPQT